MGLVLVVAIIVFVVNVGPCVCQLSCGAILYGGVVVGVVVVVVGVAVDVCSALLSC